MCGIHVIIDKTKQLSPKTSLSDDSPISRMVQNNVHRGPDHQDVFCFNGAHWRVFLGSNRLKIIGKEDKANQPFFAEDSRYATVYNGAIYNFYDLRNELLSSGEHFSTHSDTEVLSKLLVRDYKHAVSRLNGMFAFAFYDTELEQLLLARDPFGMKPLFHYEDEHFHIISSDINGIMASGLVKSKLQNQEVQHYLSFKYASSPGTFYEGIFEFEAGTHMIISPSISAESGKFSNSNISQTNADLNDQNRLLDQAETILSDALLRHLIADVPCGLFLSGGVDSTLLLALIHKLSAHPVETFTIVPESDEKNFGTTDAKYARLAAKQYGNYHYEVPVGPDILDNIPDFVRFLDQPIADSASLLTFILSKEARKKVGVVLSGAGADELFGGYNRHFAFYQYLKNYSLFSRFKPFIHSFTHLLPTGFHHPFRSYFRLLKKFGQDLGETPEETFLNFTRVSSLFSTSFSHSFSVSHPLENFVEDNLSSALNFDLTHYLKSDVLALNDRMSMAHSLEMRMPYLDMEVVQLAEQLPATYKVSQGQKWILKALLSRLGGKIYTQRKEGFGFPFGIWLRNSSTYQKIRPYFDDEKLPIYQYVSYQQVQMLLEQHRNRREDYGLILWSLLTLSAWLLHKSNTS